MNKQQLLCQTGKSITLRIARFNPEKDTESTQFMEFSPFQYEKWTTVLEAILGSEKTLMIIQLQLDILVDKLLVVHVE